MNDLREGGVLFRCKIVFGDDSSLFIVGCKGNKFFRVIEMSRKVVEDGNVLIGIDNVLQIAADVTVIDAASFGEFRVFLVEVMKLNGNEDGRSKEGRGVSLTHSVRAVHLLTIRAPYFSVSVKVSV